MPVASIAPPALPESPLVIRSSGARRLNLPMLEMLDRSDQFAGLPRGTAKPLRFLAGFQEAEPYLGLPAHAFKLVSWLVKQTQAQDWEEGSRPIAWPSARRQAEFLGLSPARVKTLNRALFETGIFVIRDNEQGKRYGRRGPDGKIIEAYGFDLSPLALRYDEFVRVAAEARLERQHMKALRGRVTFARRRVRQIGEELAALDQVPVQWRRLESETARLVAAARRCERSEDMALAVESLERLKTEAEQWLRGAQKAVETSPEGLENEPHTISTNLSLNPKKDTVTAEDEGSSRAPTPVPSTPSPVAVVTVEREFRLKVPQLLDLAPRLDRHVLSQAPDWRDIVDAAGGGLRHELGVSPSLWGEACRIMGREQAALALAIVSTKPAAHFIRGAGGYFAGMVRKAERGELHLDRSLWALREAKWGKADKRRVH
jgi:replication initiation protein RepC